MNKYIVKCIFRQMLNLCHFCSQNLSYGVTLHIFQLLLQEKHTSHYTVTDWVWRLESTVWPSIWCLVLQVIQILFNSWSLVINVDFGWCNSYPLLKLKCVFSISASRTNYEPYKTNSKSCHNGGKQYFCCSKCWFNPLIHWPPRVTR